MSPSTPPPPSQDVQPGDAHPPLPISHPRSSPRSPARSAPQPPISPPRASVSSSTLSSIPSTTTLSTSSTFSNATLPTESSRTSIADSFAGDDKSDDDSRTPNVYINGLPPNFPEDQLYTMTAEFGPVISVRTFTRHVSDRPSGYGFVLFESVDSAAKCIDALRRYRNLHPSFSKQVHKIPGTSYAHVQSTTPASSPDASGNENFKSRMERLKDAGSTNLYIEGLPLSIDEGTLTALVAPYPIKSSRFFQTRLSHPPRIIAFVRLETRTACEEVIERLHGRMVRGWNDTGSRISVRFADSAEQRDLRRNERSGREGGSPSRITMAQAALLNLRGQHTQPQISRPPSLSPTPIGSHSGGPPRLPMHPMTAPYTSRSPVHGAAASGLPGSDINLSVLRNANVDAGGFTQLEQQLILQAEIDAQRQALHDLRLQHPQVSNHISPYSPSNEFTDRTSQASLSTPAGRSTIGRPLSRLNALSSKEFIPRGLVDRMQQSRERIPMAMDGLPVMSEDEFHQVGRMQQHHHRQQQHITDTQAPFDNNYNDTRNDNIKTNTGKVIYDTNSAPERDNRAANSTTESMVLGAGARSSGLQTHGPRESHMRSTTLPPQFMHGGSGVGSSTTNMNVDATHARLNGILSPTLRSGAGASGHLNISVPSLSAPTPNTSSQQDSPLLVPSPALTYNSSSSSSLSPSTPFFGSFATGEGFGGLGVYKIDEPRSGVSVEGKEHVHPPLYTGVGMGVGVGKMKSGGD